MKKVFNINDIKEMLNDFSKIGGLDCSDVPVLISSRMKRTFGSFSFKRINGKIEAHAFKFSLKLIDGDYDEKTVRDTVGHEYAHFLVNVLDNVNHNHDRVFKEACLKLGIPEDTHFKQAHKEEVKAGYILTCSNCKREVSRRRRRDSALKIKRYYKSACCKSDIIVRKTVF